MYCPTALRSLGGKAAQQLLQIDLGIGVDRAQFFLQCFLTAVGIAANFSKPGEQADRLDDFFFLQGHDSAGPGAAGGCICTFGDGTTDVRNAAHRHAARAGIRGPALGPFRGGAVAAISAGR